MYERDMYERDMYERDMCGESPIHGERRVWKGVVCLRCVVHGSCGDKETVSVLTFEDDETVTTKEWW